MSKTKNEIDTEQLEKIVETAIYMNFPTTILQYDKHEMDDAFKPFFNIALMTQISNMLGYDSKAKFDEIYSKALKSADDETIGILKQLKDLINQISAESNVITNNFIKSYDSYFENPKKKETEEKKEIRCQACNHLLTDKVVVYRNHGYEDYYCTIDCLKSKVFQESVNE